MVLFENQKIEDSYEYDNQTGLLKIERLNELKLEEYKVIYYYEEIQNKK